jgi:hypothetical protein
MFGGSCDRPSGPVTISSDYLDPAKPIVREQLEKAGVRLAHLLDVIFKVKERLVVRLADLRMRTFSRSPSPEFGNWALDNIRNGRHLGKWHAAAPVIRVLRIYRRIYSNKDRPMTASLGRRSGYCEVPSFRSRCQRSLGNSQAIVTLARRSRADLMASMRHKSSPSAVVRWRRMLTCAAREVPSWFDDGIENRSEERASVRYHALCRSPQISSAAAARRDFPSGPTDSCSKKKSPV